MLSSRKITTKWYPFGMLAQNYNAKSYRFGFQNQEKDDEIYGIGNSINFKYRVTDTRLGRFWSIDPLASKYPHNSTYAFSENRVLDKIELEGLEAEDTEDKKTPPSTQEAMESEVNLFDIPIIQGLYDLITPEKEENINIKKTVYPESYQNKKEFNLLKQQERYYFFDEVVPSYSNKDLQEEFNNPDKIKEVITDLLQMIPSPGMPTPISLELDSKERDSFIFEVKARLRTLGSGSSAIFAHYDGDGKILELYKYTYIKTENKEFFKVDSVNLDVNNPCIDLKNQ